MKYVRGDRVVLPKRLGGSDGIVVADTGTFPNTTVARVVNGKTRHTVVPTHELVREGHAPQKAKRAKSTESDVTNENAVAVQEAIDLVEQPTLLDALDGLS